MNESEAAQFERDYREIVKPLWDSAADSIHGDQIDYAALVDDLRTLNDREDRLFATLRGPDGVAKIRAQLIEKRTRLIAMLEAYAESRP